MTEKEKLEKDLIDIRLQRLRATDEQFTLARELEARDKIVEKCSGIEDYLQSRMQQLSETEKYDNDTTATK